MESQLGTVRGDTARLLVPGRVVSTCRIPQGTISSPIEPASIRGNINVMQISVGVDGGGRLDLEQRSESIWGREVHWARAMRLAEDCHSYNVQLRKLVQEGNDTDGSVKLVLQVVRQVEAGQELLLWFSEDILASMHMVFLTPANIQGQKNYVCTHCSALYEFPNPLKLHLTLGCGRYPVSALWEKLSQSLVAETDTTITSTSHEFKFQLVPEQAAPKQKTAIDLSAPPEKRAKHEHLYKPYTTSGSAFRPFQKNENNNTVNMSTYWPSFVMPQDYVHAPLLAGQTFCDDQAQIETLVSSLGKLKEGHVCLYCGKSYSRKYGLKIHIRTHTGYKPLKCKFCLRPFGDPSNLNKHVRLHAEGETPYKCELCGKVLVRRRDLERHLKSRHTHDMHPVMNITDDDSNEISDEEKVISVDK